ncbi:hypothetical protein HRbin15_01208 [bacterium HR15]|nr:hypothetical protein HRbin15_01208 [bacterium HR15]
MGTRLFFGLVGLITALLAAWGLEQLFRAMHLSNALQDTRVLLFRTDPEIVRRLRERGAQFGNPQLSLMWNNTNDLDLHCIEPTGVHIWFRNRRSERTGGELDVDANADPTRLTERPVENIYWTPGNAPQGEYEVYVHHFANHGAPDPTSYTLRIVANGRVREFRGSLRLGEESRRVRFDPAQVQDWEMLEGDSRGWLALLVMGGWGALLGLLLALMLRLPQRWFGVDVRHFGWRQVLSGLAGGAILGAVGGGIGQLIFYPLTALSELFARYLGLLVLGGLLGYGLHHFVPNLPLNPARVAGAVGGLLGAYGFLWSLTQWDDGVGRLVVAMLLGLSIGLMITIQQVRRAIIRVRSGGHITTRQLTRFHQVEVQR